LPLKLNARFTFSHTVLNLAKFSLVFKLNIDFTVSYSLLNFAMFSFNSSISNQNVACISFVFSVSCIHFTLFTTVSVLLLLSFVQTYSTSQSLSLGHPNFLPYLKSERNFKSSIRQLSHCIHYFCHSGSTHMPNLLPTFTA